MTSECCPNDIQETYGKQRDTKMKLNNGSIIHISTIPSVETSSTASPSLSKGNFQSELSTTTEGNGEIIT